MCSWLSYTEEVASEVPLGVDIVRRLQRFGTYGRLKQIALRKVAHNIASDSALVCDLKAAFQQLDPQGTGQPLTAWLTCKQLASSNGFTLVETLAPLVTVSSCCCMIWTVNLSNTVLIKISVSLCISSTEELHMQGESAACTLGPRSRLYWGCLDGTEACNRLQLSRLSRHSCLHVLCRYYQVWRCTEGFGTGRFQFVPPRDAAAGVTAGG